MGAWIGDVVGLVSGTGGDAVGGTEGGIAALLVRFCAPVNVGANCLLD